MTTPPNILHHLDRILSIVRSGKTGLLSDFDGTVSEIVNNPQDARISAKAATSLGRLAGRLALVAVVSGRSVSDLQSRVGLDGVVYVGNHGAEYLDGRGLTVAPQVAQYADRVERALESLQSRVRVRGLVWDNKRFSASIHYRLADDPDEARRALQTAVELEHEAEGLEVFWGKRVLELRAPAGVDKGYAVRRLIAEHGLEAAVVLGDDTTDADAFTAVADLEAQGALQGVSVAVLHDDTPDELLQAARYSLSGVGDVERFLHWLDTVTP